MDPEVINGYSYEDLLADADSWFPPMRPEGLGITVTELTEATGAGKALARNRLRSMGFVPVEMRINNTGRPAHVFMKPKDAEQYKEWIAESPQ